MNKIFAMVLSVIMSLGICNNTNKASDTTNDKYTTYINENLGFSLDIPLEWNGYYNIIENTQSVTFMFCGESDICTKYNESGLLMFYIASDTMINSESLDSIRKIGKVQDVDYYYATSTDASLTPIMLVNNELINEALEMYGVEQTELMKRDWERIQKMSDDIPNILQSFKEIQRITNEENN